MSNAPSTATAGDIITARPWVNGTETDTQPGVVYNAAFGNDGEHALVWFPALGPFSRDEVGHALQPILHGKYQVTGHVSQWSNTKIKAVAKLLNRLQIHDSHELYDVLRRLAH